MFNWLKKRDDENIELNLSLVPKNVALIMDGNGRWAKQKKLPVSFGHSKGVEIVESTIEYAKEIGIEIISFYAFSTENWKRDKEEIDHLFKLLFKFYDSKFKKMVNNNIKLIWIGSETNVPNDILELFKKMENESKNCDGMIVNLAFNYGSRLEIVEAVNMGLNDGIEKFDEDILQSYLYTKNQPNIDLMIRTSGEMRLSNFLLWQNAYSEFVFVEKYWPDFTKKEFERALLEYQKRNRRFGGR